MAGTNSIMDFIVDNRTIHMFVRHPEEVLKIPFLNDPGNHLSFFWPSFLECLDMGTLLKDLPPFTPDHSLFQAFLAALLVNQEKESLFYLYDSLFAECLTQIKALPQINPSFLLVSIKAKEFLSALGPYERELQGNTLNTMHDLILYLAWDRMCVSVSRLFDHQSNDPRLLQGLKVFRECLIESYLHIRQQGRTKPSLYRLIEALFFYEMREENLQNHSAEEWEILSRNIQILKPQDELADFYYIDGANHSNFLTLDAPEKVKLRLDLANVILKKLNLEITEWNVKLQNIKIIYLEEERIDE